VCDEYSGIDLEGCRGDVCFDFGYPMLDDALCKPRVD
jgi:hypothetical protein